jgi:hypothetical protein
MIYFSLVPQLPDATLGKPAFLRASATYGPLGQLLLELTP